MSTASKALAPEPGISIRAATTADIPALTRVINAAFVVEQIAFDGDRVDDRGVRAYLSRGHFLLAETAGVCVGCVFIEPRADRSCLGLLSVDPARQGKGLGRRLIAAAEELARSLGSRAMDLRVISPRADQLLPFYEHLGYSFVRNQPFPPAIVPKVPSHYLLMSKLLL